MFQQKFRNFSIYHKILVGFLVFILLTVLLVIFPIYQKVFSVIQGYIRDQAIDTVTQAGVALDNTLDSVNYMADFIAYNGDTQSTLSSRLNDPYESYQSIPPGFSSLMEHVLIINYSSLKLNRIDIFGDNGMIFEVPNSKPSYSEEEMDAARQIAHMEEGRCTWSYFRENEYCLLKEIRNVDTTMELGCLLISVKKEFLNRNLDTLFMSGRGSVIVLDSEGNFICGEEQDPSLYQTLHQTSFSSTDFHLIPHGSQKLWTTCCKLSSKGLSLYGIIPETALYEDSHRLIEWIILFVVAILLVILLCAIVFAGSIARPLTQLKNAMDTVSEGDFTNRVPVTSTDEVGQLAQHYNEMIDEIQYLIDNVYKQQLLQKEAEFQMLQAQINPHFIYNVLDSIGWTARSHHVDEIADMVSSFSKLLRLSISKRTNITVEEELECIKNYLFIQKIRYKDRLSAIIDVDSRLLPLVIPKLILEPLVENAVVHGLENKDSANGIVMLTGELQEKTVLFFIKDNGIGISKDRIDEIMNHSAVPGSTHTGLGLMTVHKRIQHIYGTDYGISIESHMGAGTKIMVRFPYCSLDADALSDQAASLKHEPERKRNAESIDCR